MNATKEARGVYHFKATASQDPAAVERGLVTPLLKSLQASSGARFSGTLLARVSCLSLRFENDRHSLDCLRAVAQLVMKPAPSLGIPRWLRLPELQQPAVRTAGDPVSLRLIERLQSGDLDVVDELYRAHHLELRTFAQRLLGDRVAAEDLLHDVFLDLPRTLRNFRGESTLRCFLIGVMAWRSTRHVRAARRRRNAAMTLQLQPTLESTTPETELRRMERARALTRALDRLPISQRTVFVLLEVEERSAAEVATILGIPEGTVRTRCFNARKKLAAWLREGGT